MDFYSELAKYYNLAFPFEETIGNFLKNQLDNEISMGSNILDIACGTGIYTSYLAENDIEITGLDSDSKMISEASTRFHRRNLHFINGDMLNLKESLKKKQFGGAYCIGNSIVHLKNEKNIEQFFDKCHEIMKIGGTLIIQTINFDRIIDKDVKELPTLENDEIKFIRGYSPLGKDHVNFNTVITIKKEKKSFSNSIPLLALKKDDIITILKKTGFRVKDTFGSYGHEIWNIDSFLTIVTAEAMS